MSMIELIKLPIHIYFQLQGWSAPKQSTGPVVHCFKISEEMPKSVTGPRGMEPTWLEDDE